METVDLLYEQYVDYVNSHWNGDIYPTLAKNGLIVETSRIEKDTTYRLLMYDEFYKKINELYKSYVQYVHDEWEMGAINELMADEFTLVDTIDDSGNETHRVLTEQEFVEHNLHLYNNNFNG